MSRATEPPSDPAPSEGSPSRLSTDEADDRARTDALRRIATLRLESQIPPIVSALERAGVASIVLKGPSTRRRMYGSDEARDTGDIDLLVAPRQQRRAGRVLRELGFVRVDSVAHADTWRNRRGVHLDLHRTIPYAGVEPTMVWRVLSLHTVDLDLPAGTIPVLNVPAHFVHLAVHAVQTDIQRTPRPLAELQRAMARTSPEDRGAARHIAEVLGLSGVVDLALTAAEVPVGAPDVRQRLPVVHPRQSTTSAYLKSPVSRSERARALRRSTRVFWSDRSLRDWLQTEGRDLPSGRGARQLAKVRRTVVVLQRRIRTRSSG